MSKRGLPSGVGLKHDSHYVEELTRVSRAIGKTLPIDKIEPNPTQPRSEMGDLTELTESIKQKGVLEPILVFPNRDLGTWTIIAGERRWRAASMAGLKEIPCVELDLDEKEVAEIALIENLQRKDLTVWEEADGLAALARRFGYTHEEIAKRIGKSRTSVTESLSIANLPDNVRKRCIQLGINSKSTLLEVARQFDESQMMKFLDLYSQSSTRSRDDVRKLARESSGVSAKNQVRISDNRITKNKVATFSHDGILIEVFCSTRNPDSELLIKAVELFLENLRERHRT